MRDSILHAIQCWKALPGTGSPEPSEVGSSTKGSSAQLCLRTSLSAFHAMIYDAFDFFSLVVYYFFICTN